jgi:hypothetical protein
MIIHRLTVTITIIETTTISITQSGETTNEALDFDDRPVVKRARRNRVRRRAGLDPAPPHDSGAGEASPRGA